VPRIGAHPSPGTSPPGNTGDSAGQRTAGGGQTVPCQRDPASLATAIGELLELSDERDSWIARLIAAGRDGYARGLADGVALGRRLEAAELDEAWNRIAGPISRIDPAFMSMRWAVRGEPRTRETFSRAHPGDFKGREGAA
jgi:hypothetical protein